MGSLLAPFVSDLPAVTYRRAPSVSEKLVASEYKSTKGDIF